MFSLPICPHCKETALYTEAFLAKNRKKYRCKNCGEIVSVMIKESVFKFLWIIQLFAIFIFSPFMLSIEHARIYDLDARPVRMREWYELENMRTYYQLFKQFEKRFEENR